VSSTSTPHVIEKESLKDVKLVRKKRDAGNKDERKETLLRFEHREALSSCVTRESLVLVGKSDVDEICEVY
jgi:Mg/Co/Ni transporter MgtE